MGLTKYTIEFVASLAAQYAASMQVLRILTCVAIDKPKLVYIEILISSEIEMQQKR